MTDSLAAMGKQKAPPRTGTAEGVPRIRVSRVGEVAAAVDSLGLGRGRPVLVLVGGAGGMDQEHDEVLGSLLVDRVLPLIGRDDGAVVDGGTDSGVMRVVGQARATAGGGFPLVGVAAEGTVNVPGRGAGFARRRGFGAEPHAFRVGTGDGVG